MDEIKSSGRCNWKISGHIIGWLGIVLSVGFAAYMGASFFTISWKTLFLFFLNLMACVSWLCGIIYEKATLIQIPLFFWTLLVGFRIGTIFREIIESKVAYNPQHHIDSYVIAVLFTAYFLAAAFTYKYMDRDLFLNTSDLPQFNTPHTTPIETSTLRV